MRRLPHDAIPVKPETVGDHLRLRRLNLKLFQRQVAERLGVDTTSIRTWEASAAQPGLRYMPAIIEFLGYNPLPPAKTWAERLVRHRKSLGLTREESARRIGVDPSTLAKWERGEREPAGAFAARAERLLPSDEDLGGQVRRAG